MKNSRILAMGSFLPEKILSNKDLEKIVDTSDEWILQRTGIKRRHVISEGESVSTMAIAAAKQALERSKLNPEDVEMIICATCTSDLMFPAVACQVQRELNIPDGPAFDIQAACSGFIYGLSIADKYIKTGTHKKILVIGTEALSQVVDWKDRSTCVLFGDGAGAAILEASDEPGIITTLLHANGNYADLLFQKSSIGAKGEDAHVFMDGNRIFKLAVKALEKIVLDTVEAAQISPEEIDWLVPHQANIRIIQATAKKLNLPMDRVVLKVEEHANTSAASIPLALDIAIQEGKVKRGQNILLEAFGAGLTWGSALIRY